MSLALRIFIVLTLVMTLAFMFIQMQLFATRENWKRRWDADTKFFANELKQATEQLTLESAEKVKYGNTVAMLQSQLSEHEKKIKDLNDTVTERSTSIQRLQADLDKGKTDYNRLNEDYQAQTKSLEMVRTRNAELTSIASVARAVAFNLNVKLAEVEDDLNNLQTQHTRTNEELQKLTGDYKQSQAFISQVQTKFPQVWESLKNEQGSAEVLRATVSAVRPMTGPAEFVMLSIGKDEGVKEGQEFIIYRGDKYICKVRVEKVMNDMAPARIIPSSWNTNGLIVQPGDTAANRL